MKFVEYKLATGAMLTGYLRDETTEMPSYNTRPAVLILPGGGYRYCSPREAADKITIVGFSAGAHLAASTALLWDATPVQQALGITGTEARPNAVVLGYPVITSGKFAHRGSFENLCGADEALLQTMSLENQVRPDVPPFIIWHTVEDQAVPVENSLLLAGALKENNVPFELHLFTHGGHGSSTCTNEVNTPNKHNNAWLPLCMGWLGETLDFTL